MLKVIAFLCVNVKKYCIFVKHKQTINLKDKKMKPSKQLLQQARAKAKSKVTIDLSKGYCDHCEEPKSDVNSSFCCLGCENAEINRWP